MKTSQNWGMYIKLPKTTPVSILTSFSGKYTEVMFISVEIRYMLSHFTKSAITAGTAAGCLLLSAGSASALTFQTNWSGVQPKGDIYLDSVKIGDKTISDFTLVSGVDGATFENDPYMGGNSGAASGDRGDMAVNGPLPVEAAGPSDVVASLGNQYLSSIIDTEDSGSFFMDLTFDKAFDTLLFWERGINSKLGVTINDVTRILTKDDFRQGKTDFQLDTTEIGGAQNVGSYGLSLTEFGISGDYTGPVTIFSEGSFKGPDWKVAGVAAVPEPATVLGLTAVAGAFVASRRRKNDLTA